MKLKLFVLVVLLFQFSIAQQANRKATRNVTVTGKIFEATDNVPLEYATVAVTDTNGELVAGGITNFKGDFSIDVPAGLFKMTFEFIGFVTQTLQDQNLQRDTKLATIFLKEDLQALDEVVIRNETTEVQVRLDKKIYNIGKDLTTKGATVGDALSNVPSVTVDVDGAIALRGNENVRILINGKPSAIAGFGSTDALQQLPAEAIERVEVITSPSARYDAEGTAGILNIILRKEKTLGVNGSIQTTIGNPNSAGIIGNINLRTDKFNVFNTIGFRYRDTPGNALFKNVYKLPEVQNPLVVEERLYERLNRNFNTNLGIEYDLSEKSSITASAFYQFGNDDDITTNTTTEFSRTNDIAINRLRVEDEAEDDRRYQFSLNHSTKFDEKGHKLTSDLQFGKNTEAETSFIAERNTFPDFEELPAELITSNEIRKRYLGQTDYVRPIGKNAQFEAGYRGNFTETETDYLLTEQQFVNGDFIRNNGLSNKFTYTENVHALYTQYGNKFGKFSFLAGLRFENTQLKGKVDATDVDATTSKAFNINFNKNYAGLFPTLNLIYELNENENITLGYNRRINRPRGRFINPFPSRSSEANVFQGNPNLDPSYANALDLGYLKQWDDLTFTTSVYYQYETDAFERIQEDTGNETMNGIPIIRTLPINLSTRERLGFEAGVIYNPIKWLRFNGSFNLFQFNTVGSFNTIDYGTKNTSYFTRGSAKVRLPYKIDWQTNVFYRGPRNNSQTTTKDILSVNLAFSKDVLKDKGTLGLNVSDLFNSRKRRSFTDTNTFTSENEFQWRQRAIRISFSYRFNQSKKRNQSQSRNSNADDFEE